MEIRHAAQYSMHNRKTLEEADHCGCYYCLAEFSPDQIKEWTDEEQTAICPYCSVDAILADSADCIISREFLVHLHNFWF